MPRRAPSSDSPAAGGPIRVPMWGVDVAKTGDVLRVVYEEPSFSVRANGSEKLRTKVPSPPYPRGPPQLLQTVKAGKTREFGQRQPRGGSFC